MKLTIVYLLLLFAVSITQIYASDTLLFKSPNGRFDCTIICQSQKGTYSEAFLQQLSQTRQGSEYILNDSSIIVDKKDTLMLPSFNLQDFGNYVSAHTCFHQRNYSLSFKKVSIDSYKGTLNILTDWRQATIMEFIVILQPLLLISKNNIQYKDQNGNLKFTANVPSTIIMENLFIENQPCPRTIMFPK
jgi:hypothetical protein